MKLRLITLVFSVLVTGCVTTESQRISQPDPDQRLDRLLDTHNRYARNQQECLELDRVDGAVKDCGRLLTELQRLYFEFPGHARTALSHAVLQYQYGQRSTAALVLDQLLPQHPDYPGAALLRSRIALENGNTTHARRIGSQRLKRRPGDAQMHEMLAAINFIEGRYKDARKHLATAFRLGAPRWRLDFHSGLIAEVMGDTARACRLFHNALKRKPDLEKAQHRLQGLASNNGCRIAASSKRHRTPAT